ncbi:polysaccharide biosynthesis PFTS motif-containing protein [Candidatus Planktophila dulcis]|uniref:Polysaccharide biosynthesis PFTS motif-containing protein n=1 Tax=Candidatus Planktophila dulcis TaxID=1884914 RepID=A0AAD0E4Y0_9ACTN|nr:hypothetical protein [Candidatus Planktophila dulcis]ASY11448.1 polysaccharide biosynthesis PFTS motif-containing protein [Candidatus Planktophila dulcis]
MLSDWRPLANRIQQALSHTPLSSAEKSLIRDLIISSRKLHLKPEPEWKSLSKIPLVEGMSFDVESGRINSDFSRKLAELTKLLKYLFALTVSLTFARKRVELQDKKLTLFYSDGFNNEKRVLFSEFIEESRFAELAHGRTMVIQDRNSWKSQEINGNFYVKDIGFFLVTNVLSRREKSALLFRIIKEVLLLNKVATYNYLGAHRVIAENPLWNSLFTQNLNLKLVATNSYMEILPTPFYSADKFGIHRYMIWYSNNNFSIPSAEGTKIKDNRLDFACRTDIDTHFVWTSDFAQSISNRNLEVEVRVLGSMMMYPRRELDPILGKFKIAVFDMTPWEGYPLNMYGSELFMQSFLEDIVSICTELPGIQVFLKPKRDFIRGGNRYVHSRKYLELLDKFEIENKITVLDPSTNIYGLAEKSDFTLGFPFASPVIIGKELSKPSYYYNPELSKSWDLRDSMDGIEVISGRNKLKTKVEEAYRNKLKNS